MSNGKVQSYFREGFGFIRADKRDQKVRVWFHISQWQNGSREPRPGDVVSFEPGKDSGGRNIAKNIRLLSLPVDMCNRTDPLDRGSFADPVDVNEGLLRYLRPNPNRRDGVGNE